MTQINRHYTKTTKINQIKIGSTHPIAIQSMTNTDTTDRTATVKQIYELAKAGSEMVRITVNNADAAKQVAYIIDDLDAKNCHVPIIGDFHYNGHKLLSDYPECAKALAKYRINPGNVGRGKKRDSQFSTLIELACKYDKAVRIGVNWGSLDESLVVKLMDQNQLKKNPLPANDITRTAMVTSALDSAQKAMDIGLNKNRLVLSCKMSGVQDLIAVYQDLAAQSDLPLHLGLTEAGMGSKGIVASTAAIGILLQQGIGDTIRVSLTPAPKQSRTQEVIVAQEILQTMGLRAFTPMVTACPGCGRTTSDYFQQLAEKISTYTRAEMPQWKKTYPGVEEMTLAVMGCVVNGPGESRQANIGISLPGTGERPVAPVYVDGMKTVTLKGDHIAEEFQAIVLDYVKSHYG